MSRGIQRLSRTLKLKKQRGEHGVEAEGEVANMDLVLHCFTPYVLLLTFCSQTVLPFCTGCKICAGPSLFNKVRTCKFYLADKISGARLVLPLTSPPTGLLGPSVSVPYLLVIPGFMSVSLRWTFFVIFS